MAASTRDRISALAIPPAWTDVWICPSPDGHLQATGRDARGRKQYRYHAAFRHRRDAGKFDRLVAFGERLPALRRRASRDLRLPGLPREKVVAAVVRLLELTSVRVGNEAYARLNRSFGLSTLRVRHVRVRGGSIVLRFRGKGGRAVEAGVFDRRLAAVVRRCQDLPGQALFEYLDEDGRIEPIDSADVNAYIREALGDDRFSAKDLRTWAGTLAAFRALHDGSADVREAVRAAADALGNTPAVTRSSYIHPAVLEVPADDPAAGGLMSRSGGRRSRRAEELALLRVLRRRKARAAGSGRNARSRKASSASRSQPRPNPE